MSDRERILARRAKFMIAALATVSVGVVACKDEAAPQGVPNEVKRKNDAGISSSLDEQPDTSTPLEDAPVPRPCLKMAMPRDAAPIPMPCLTVAAPHDAGPPPPMPCLSVAYDPDAGPKPTPCLSPKKPDLEY